MKAPGADTGGLVLGVSTDAIVPVRSQESGVRGQVVPDAMVAKGKQPLASPLPKRQNQEPRAID